MRVLIIYEHCSPHQVTAVEHARQMFHQQGHELIPLEFYYGSLDYSWTLHDKHRPEHWLCSFPDKKKVTDFKLFQDVRINIKKLQIDVVVVNGWYGLFVWWMVLLKRWIGCRMVMVSDSVYWDVPRTWAKELPKKWLLRGIDAGFVAGNPQAKYLQSLGMAADQLSFGCDVVDNALYSSIPLRLNPSSRKIVIGTAARLISKKNLSSAMRAFDVVRRNHSELTMEWRIAGQGPLDAELKQLAQELQAPVVFQGFVGYYDMPGFYQQLDLYWQPSLSEPWGLVVNEAMAAGLPIVASDRCGCVHDLVTASNGWIHQLSEQGMIECLEQALAELDHWPQRGCASRELIKQWDVSRYSEGLLQACLIAFKSTR